MEQSENTYFFRATCDYKIKPIVLLCKNVQFSKIKIKSDHFSKFNFVQLNYLESNNRICQQKKSVSKN